MNLKNLSNDALLGNLKALRGTERATTLSILWHLVELEDRGLYRDAGYSSMFDYCTRCLGYSEGSAGRRVAGARCLREHPELAEMFLAEKVTLCTISAAAQSFKAKLLKAEDISGKSTREVQMLAAPALESKPREVIKPVKVMTSAAPLLSEPAEPKEERYEIKFSVTKEVYEEFQKARSELSNELGRDLSIEAVFGKLLKNRRRRRAATPRNARTDTRYIPVPVKEQVRERDEGQCSYVAPDGTRCRERHYLQIDHVIPFAVGGKSEVQNLRLLCPGHNKLEAERGFGKGYIQSRLKWKRATPALEFGKKQSGGSGKRESGI